MRISLSLGISILPDGEESSLRPNTKIKASIIKFMRFDLCGRTRRRRYQHAVRIRDILKPISCVYHESALASSEARISKYKMKGLSRIEFMRA